MLGGLDLKALFRIFISLMIILAGTFYFSVWKDEQDDSALIEKNTVNHEETQEKENDPIESFSEDGTNPKQGLAIWIGKTGEELIEEIGEPNRVDLSAYGYEWWVYNDPLGGYAQFGVNEDNKIATLFSSAEEADLYPFYIGQEVDTLYKRLNMNSFVEVTYNGTTYRFELSEEDLHYRPLVKLGDIYAQVYLDKFLGEISGVRYMDKETLILHRPYELTYRGKLHEAPEPTEEEWRQIEAGSEAQVLDLTNIIRTRMELSVLKPDEETSAVAFLHSEDMMENDYFSHESIDGSTLADRLKRGNVPYMTAGENIAANYTDAVAAVEGWLNSKGHRENMLNKDYTHLGVGVYHKYYTQNFIGIR